jgi:peptidoglycan/xylan/chitin deacetylase (PgdA/CDA1 family)
LFSRVLKLVISTGFFVGLRLENAVLRILGKKTRASCVLLYYHAISANQRPAFADQMDKVVRFTQSIAIDRVPQMQPGQLYSAITFDDGFENAIENAVPELLKRKIPATFFMTTNFLGESAAWWPEPDAERAYRIASLRQLQELPRDLVTVGSHTLTHPRLPLLSEPDARKELSESRRKLEESLGRQITMFSFPFGAFNEELVEWSRDAGYERVFTSLPIAAFKDPEEFVTGRVKAEPSDWPMEFYLKLVGAYCWLPYAMSFKRRMLVSRVVNKKKYLKAQPVR